MKRFHRTGIALAAIFGAFSNAAAQGTSDYYDSFYNDYYKSYPVRPAPAYEAPSVPGNMEFVSPGAQEGRHVPAAGIKQATPLAQPDRTVSSSVPQTYNGIAAKSQTQTTSRTAGGQITKTQVVYTPPRA